MELAQRAGLPAGVLNVVAGSDSQGIGEVLTQHPKIAKFTFTGSTAVGKLLMKQCASTVKISLTGGNALSLSSRMRISRKPLATVTQNSATAARPAYAQSQIYVQESVADAFTRKLQEGISRSRSLMALPPIPILAR